MLVDISHFNKCSIKFTIILQTVDSDVQAAVDMTTADVGDGVADPRLRQLRAGNVGRK